MSDKENNHSSKSEGSDVGEKRYIGYDEERKISKLFSKPTTISI